MLENDDGTKSKKVEIIAEKVTFLSSSRNDKNLENDSIVNLENDDNIEENVVKESRKKYNKKKKTDN